MDGRDPDQMHCVAISFQSAYYKIPAARFAPHMFDLKILINPSLWSILRLHNFCPLSSNNLTYIHPFVVLLRFDKR